jgi:hypothetical protein
VTLHPVPAYATIVEALDDRARLQPDRLDEANGIEAQAAGADRCK